MRASAPGLLICALLLPVSAHGQEWRGELFASQHSYAPSGAFAPEASVGGALVQSSPLHRLRLAAGRTVGEEGLAWGGLSLLARPELRVARQALRWELEGTAYGFSGGPETGRGQGALGRTGPGATLDLGGISLEMAALVGVHVMRWQTEAWTRTAPELRGRLGLSPGPGLTAGLSARALQAPEGIHAFTGGEAVWQGGPAGVWARAGRWSGESADVDAGAGAWLRASGGTEVHLGYHLAAPDPLLLDPGRRGWTLSLSHPVGARTAPPHVPLVHSPGMVTFRLDTDEVRGRPYLLGDFTGWQPIPMRREGRSWTVDVEVGAGVHLFVFRTENGQIFLPRSVSARRPDGMGGENGVLVIP
jgi:hypothetical protein